VVIGVDFILEFQVVVLFYDECVIFNSSVAWKLTQRDQVPSNVQAQFATLDDMMNS